MERKWKIMGMERGHKIFSLPLYIYISLFVLEDVATDNDTVHVCRAFRETYIVSTPWNTSNPAGSPYC